MNHFRSIVASGGILLLLAIAGLAACAPSTTTNSPAQAPTLAPTTGAIIAPAPTAGAVTPASTSAAMTATGLKIAQIQGFGLFLTDDAGRTLYAFANDTKDASNCNGACAQNWPPLSIQGTPQTTESRINTTLLGTITRADGKSQVTYDGHPLYYYAKDQNPGDVNGQGVGNVWHVLSPRGNIMNNAAPKAPASAPTTPTVNP